MDTSGKILYLAELFTFTLRDGTILRYTTYGIDIVYDGNTYIHAPIVRTPHTQDTDLSVGETQITFPRVSPWTDPERLLSRYLDNAQVNILWLDRSLHSNKRVVFTGDTGEVSYNQVTVLATFKNLMNLFHKKVPRRKYSEGCNHRMYDTLCKLVRAVYEKTGTVESGSTKTAIIDSARVEADKYFDLGILECTSGQNNGEKRWIKNYTVGRIDIFVDLPYTPTISDTYKITPHCRKTYISCSGDYSNELNYGGFQDIPDPMEAAI